MKQDINTYDRQIEELFERHPSVQRQGFGGGAYKEGLDGIRAYDRASKHEQRDADVTETDKQHS